MQKLFRLVPLPVVVLGLFASFFINLSLSSPTEALICPAGQVEVFRGVPQYRQCATPTNRKPNEVPCAERGDDRKTILVDGECFMPAYETGSTCFNWTETLVRDPISNGSWGDRERCLGTSESQAALDYCAPYGTGWVAVPKDGEFICMASVKYEDQIGKILQPPQSGAPGSPGSGTGIPGQTNPDGTPVEGGTAATGTLMDCNVDGIGWIICPTMRVLSNALDGAFNFISEKFLIINQDIFGSSVEGFWNVFRNIANALFALVFLIVIASQVSNIGISNYGIKKLLPKLIMVAILVNLSFTLCKIAVDLSNIAGMAANNIFGGDLLATSFSEEDIARGAGVPNIQAGVITIGVLGITSAVALYIAFPTLLLVLLSGILAVLSTVVILSAREALVLLLVVVSPLAIASTLLPNTQKLFDKWKSLFMGMLLVFPIIGLIWGASSVAATILSTRVNASWIDQILALAIMCVPLFATIPVVKGSMNALGKLGGKLNDMGGKFKGGVDNWYKGSRAGKWGDHLQQNRATSRSLKQAGVPQYKGRGFNPRNWSAYANKGVNKASGQFGKDLAASGVYAADEEETKEVSQRAALLNSGYDSGAEIGQAQADLERFINSGDAQGARAAAQILAKNTGQSGRDALQASLEKMQRTRALKSGSAVSDGLKKEIGRAGIKSQNAVLDKFAMSKTGNDYIGDIRAKASTFSGLSAAEMSTQSTNNIENARASGGMNSDTAQEIRSTDSLKGNLSQDKRDQLDMAMAGDRNRTDVVNENGEVTPRTVAPEPIGTPYPNNP